MPRRIELHSGSREKLCRAIDKFWAENDYAPTVRELKELAGMSSTSVVYWHLGVLEDEGRITRKKGTARTIRTVSNDFSI